MLNLRTPSSNPTISEQQVEFEMQSAEQAAAAAQSGKRRDSVLESWSQVRPCDGFLSSLPLLYFSGNVSLLFE